MWGFYHTVCEHHQNDIFRKGVFWFGCVCVNDLFVFALEECLQKLVYLLYIYTYIYSISIHIYCIFYHYQNLFLFVLRCKEFS